MITQTYSIDNKPIFPITTGEAVKINWGGLIVSLENVLNSIFGWTISIEPSPSTESYVLSFFLNGTKVSSQYLHDNYYAYRIRAWGNFRNNNMFSPIELASLTAFPESESTEISLDSIVQFPEDTYLQSIGVTDAIKNYATINIILLKRIDGNYVQIASEIISNPMPRYWLNIRPDDQGTNVGIIYVHNNDMNITKQNLKASGMKIVFDAFNEFDENANGGVSSRNSVQYSYEFNALPENAFINDSIYLAQVPCYYNICNYMIIRIQLRNAQGFGLSETFFHNKNPYIATKKELQALEARVEALE